MSVVLAEFLAWEERQELRWEFDGFDPVAMTAGTRAHEIIGGSVLPGRAVLWTASAAFSAEP